MSPVSIVIPTYNRANLLDRTIDSCLSQTVECEIIVCDHGSTDNTPKLMQQYQDKVTYVRREIDFGPHFAWLDGVMHASNEMIHLQYDDDLIKPTFIEKTRKLLTEDVGFVFTSCELMRRLKRNTVQFADTFSKPIIDVTEAEAFVSNTIISPGCVLIRKQDAIDALYQGRLPFSKDHYHGVGPDLLFTLICLLRYSKIGFVNEPLAQFRVHPGSITIDAHANPEKRAQITAAYDEVREYYKILKETAQ